MGRLHEALLAQDFGAVLRRLPVRAGETLSVPGETPHSFGPDTLLPAPLLEAGYPRSLVASLGEGI